MADRMGGGRTAANRCSNTSKSSSRIITIATAAFFIVEAEDLNAAVAIAAGCPGADPGVIEVHQLDLTAAVGDLTR